ncbi:hypothetical protein B0H63DRAFT_538145 [Podospora didyma]|uniref:Heterokaryon incompatibility domain-containing protein n=1 Tax=Podospora didyma TaxID=330526 RepID=A0AAE0NY71_9PEZI|nr:hypothetical protein B0H63DRAFT_538145 [Podospora didyma]
MASNTSNALVVQAMTYPALQHPRGMFRLLHNVSDNLGPGTPRYLFRSYTLDQTAPTVHPSTRVVFAVLSYDTEGPWRRMPALVNGSQWAVSENLVPATRNLLDLKLDGVPMWVPHILWSPEPCVNGNDLGEKSAQGCIADRIIRRADRTYVWIGKDNVMKELSIACQKPFIESWIWEDGNGDDQIMDRVLQVTSILDIPWWAQMRNVQEIVMSQNDPVFVHGTHGSSWTRVTSYIFGTIEYAKSRLPVSEIAQLASKKLSDPTAWGRRWKNYSVMVDLDNMRRNFQKKVRLSLFEGLVMTTTRTAKLPHDRIWGLVGLLHDTDRVLIPPLNYAQPFPQLCWDMMRNFWDRCNLINLLPIFQFLPTAGPGYLPSWIPDFTTGNPPTASFLPSQFQPDPRREHEFLDRPERVGNRDFLCWKGCEIDGVRDYWRIPTIEEIEIEPKELETALQAISIMVDNAQKRLEFFKAPLGPGTRDDFQLSSFNALLMAGQEYDKNQEENIAKAMKKAWFPGVIGALVLHQPMKKFAKSYNPDPAFFKEILEKELVNLQPWFDCLIKTAPGLTFFTTNRGYLGFAKAKIKTTDIVAQLNHLDCPMVMRKNMRGLDDVEDYSMVGLAYLATFMRTDFAAGFELDEGWFPEELFRIC